MALRDASRGTRTALVGLGLIAVYLAYSQITRPLLSVNRAQQRPGMQTPVSENRSPVFSQLAEKSFDGDSWVHNANGRFRYGNRLLFFENQEIFNDNHSIRLKPIAILWQNDTDDEPVTVTADSVQLDASTALNLSEGQFGKLTSGLLSGAVRITGPGGMKVEGRTFFISDDARKLWTSEPVQFAWDHHTGLAEGGAEIELIGSEDPENNGLLSITDVQRIRLLGRVHCDLMFVDQSGRREPMPLKISAANGFEYFVPTREATFSGFSDRPLRPDNQVLVERPLPGGTSDQLYCSRIVLKLQPEVSEKPGSSQTSQLTVAEISADGRKVLFRSEQQRLMASMNQLRYRIEDHVMEMIGRPNAATGKTNPVEIHQDSRKLTAPSVTVSLDQNNQIRSIRCNGPGSVNPSDSNPFPAAVLAEATDRDLQVEAEWQQSLVWNRSEQETLQLTGDSKIRYPEQELQLAGEEITLTLISQTDSAADSASEATGISLSRLQPQLLQATGNVRLDSPAFSGNARESLTVQFHPAEDTTPAPTPQEGGLETVSATEPDSEKNSPTLPAGRTSFFCDTIESGLRYSNGRSTRFENIWLRGNVAVTYESEKQNDSFTAQGNALHAVSGFDGSREINLFGDPASVIRDSNRIDGPRIDLNELLTAGVAKREAKVEGSGRIRFVIDKGLDGNSLSRPAPLDIYWNERMTFSGRTAHFVGNVRAVLNNEIDLDAELTCAGMKVFFAQDVQIERQQDSEQFQMIAHSENKTEGPLGRNEIEKVECEGRVVVNMEMLQEGTITARHHAEFANLQIHQKSGEFHGAGPGFIESIQPDTSRRLTVSGRAVARANTPVKTPDQAFMFVRATFIGNLEGNHATRFVRLRQHVRGVFGPVRSLNDKIRIDGLGVSELPDNTGSMGCENLTVSMSPEDGEAETSFSLVAESNASGGSTGTRAPCRLESRLFSGDADKITYDHAKQQYILRAEEGRQAKVTYVPNGGEPQTLTGRRFEYYSDRNQLNANQITGVQATGDL